MSPPQDPCAQTSRDERRNGDGRKDRVKRTNHKRPDTETEHWRHGACRFPTEEDHRAPIAFPFALRPSDSAVYVEHLDKLQSPRPL
jgi:hypothetical protein